MADSLGFGVLAGIPGPEWIEALAQLPEPARSRFQHQPEELRAETLSKIQSWK
jgi:hypothetical protein